MITPLQKALLTILEQLSPDTIHKAFGICSNVRRNIWFKDFNDAPIDDQYYTSGIMSALYSLMDKWPKHSGNIDYPVSDTIYNPIAAYHANRNHWDITTDYGKNRYELLNWLIDQLKAMDT